MPRSVRILMAVGMVALMASAGSAQDAPRLAVLPFDAAPGGWTVPPRGLGETVAELMLDRLTATGAYQIVDGQWLEPAGQGSRDEAAMARLLDGARESGVEFVLLGSITRFSTEKRHRGFGAAGFILPLLAAGRRQKQEMVVSVMARIVEVGTGRVVATASADGTSARTNRGLGGIAPFRRGGIAGFSSGSTAPREALLAEAIRDAVVQAADRLVQRAPSLAPFETSPKRESSPRGATSARPELALADTQPCPPDVCVG